MRDADAILTCFAHVTPAVVAAGERLRVIGRYGVGTDNIAVDEATRARHPGHQRARLLHRRGGRARARDAARARARDPRATTARCATATGRSPPGCRPAASRARRSGIVGFGAIGRALARTARGLGMEVLVHTRERRRRRSSRRAALARVRRRLAARARHAETERLVDARVPGGDEADRLPHQLRARGAIVDHDALRGALRDGDDRRRRPRRLRARAPPARPPAARAGQRRRHAAHRLLLRGVDRDLARLAAENVADVLAGRRPAAIVNPEVLDGR